MWVAVHILSTFLNIATPLGKLLSRVLLHGGERLYGGEGEGRTLLREKISVQK